MIEPGRENAIDGQFEARCEELLAQAEVSVEDWDGVTDRLAQFVMPFVAALAESAQQRHFTEYVEGLLSTLERKTGEGRKTEI